MNEHFNARIPLTSDNILVANGATTLLDTLTYNIADEGDSILLPTPSYGMFAHDISTRNQVRLVEVPCDDIPDDRFTGQPTSNGDGARQCEIVARLEDAIERELSQGRKVAGVLLANPENPLGRCYSAHVLLQISQLCSKYKVHLVVDEIYAMTGDNFSSMLSLGLDTNFRNVHVLWGMSKVSCGDLAFCPHCVKIESALSPVTRVLTTQTAGLWTWRSQNWVPCHVQPGDSRYHANFKASPASQ